MSRALLDINVLVALLDSDHVHHRRARDWISEQIGHGWASCPITENGFVRIISQPRYPSPVPPGQAMERLRRATGTGHHEFWSCGVSLLDPDVADPDRIHGPRQVTDAYLLALAMANNGRFVTFDNAVPLSAVPGAGKEHLIVV